MLSSMVGDVVYLRISHAPPLVYCRVLSRGLHVCINRLVYSLFDFFIDLYCLFDYLFTVYIYSLYLFTSLWTKIFIDLLILFIDLLRDVPSWVCVRVREGEEENICRMTAFTVPKVGRHQDCQWNYHVHVTVLIISGVDRLEEGICYFSPQLRSGGSLLGLGSPLKMSGTG